MKKIIATLAMIALVGGAAFAEAAVSGAVIGTVQVLGSDTSDATDGKIFGDGGMNRIRFEASGSSEDETFGAWLRIEGGMAGNAWWKPIDQLLVRVGGSGGDGFFGKEGNTGWMFYQTVSDTGVSFAGDNVWGGSVYLSGLDKGMDLFIDAMIDAELAMDPTYAAASDDEKKKIKDKAKEEAKKEAEKEFDGIGFNTRSAFYSGFGGNGLMLEIKPVDVFGLNIVLPYFEGGEVKDIFGNLTIQADVNLDFGNIALTYEGDSSDATNGNIFLYFGLSAIENIAIDFGVGTTLAGDVEGFPLNVGVGAKVDVSDAFGLKARLVAGIPTDSDDKLTKVLFDVLPYFALNDAMTVFVSVGLGLLSNDGDAWVGFHFNPYLQVGSEWGPKFLAGIKVWQDYAFEGKDFFGSDACINWQVPIAISVSF